MSGMSEQEREALREAHMGFATFAEVERIVAAREAALAERIAQAIESHYLGADYGRNYDGTESRETALGHAHDEGLHDAARIAREIGGQS